MDAHLAVDLALQALPMLNTDLERQNILAVTDFLYVSTGGRERFVVHARTRFRTSRGLPCNVILTGSLSDMAAENISFTQNI